jgi:uncharacterized repeat protein (TIGR01451 family)
VTATVDPREPVPGEPAVVTVTVRNDGERPVPDLVLTDEVSASAAVRSAWSPAGDCAVSPGRASCPLGGLAPGDSVSAQVRLLLADEPATPAVVHRITLSAAAGGASVVDRSISTPIDPGPPSGAGLLALPGTTVTVIAFVGFVLAARSSPPTPS